MTLDSPVKGLAYLERQYDNRGKVTPDQLQAYRSYWAEESEQARSLYLIAANVRYGSGPNELLDVLGVRTQEKKPVHVYIHGGYWHFGDKHNSAYIALAFPEDVITVTLNYCLAPSCSIAEQVSQCKRALRWLCSNIAEYGGDPDKILLTGHSAGAHLAAMVLTEDLARTDGHLPRHPVKGAILLSGIYDLTDIQHLEMNQVLKLAANNIDALNPSLRPPQGEPSIYIAAGELEGEEFLKLSATLASIWGGVSQRVQHAVLPGADHFSIRSDWERMGNPINAVLRSMLNRIKNT